MSGLWEKYKKKKLLELSDGLRSMKAHRFCYLFLLPYALLFITFNVLPIVSSVYYSFTNFNILEKPEFIGMRNYINLFLQDEVFQIAVKNTFVTALIVGPVGYILAFIFAWLINELPRWIRTIIVLFFYTPSISAQAYLVFKNLFSDDRYGWANSWLIKVGFLNKPMLFLSDPRYAMKVIIPVCLWMSLGTGFLAFVAGLKGLDKAQYEAGYIDGIQNRWQELWFVTLPAMKPQLLFGAVMQITQSFAVADISIALAGNPSVNYAGATIVTHLLDYGSTRMDMGYASAIATVLFLLMVGTNKLVQRLLRRVGE